MPLNQYKPDEDSAVRSIKSIIAVAAGKGGVGKSTVTVNLALALKQQGFAVGVLDADIYGPSIRRMLPEERLPEKKGELFIPAVCKGIKMMSMAYFTRQGEAAAVRAPIANALIAQFVKNVLWGSLDFLLIDFPPGTGDVQLTLSQQMPLTTAVMVTTPQEVALMDVRKAIHLFEQVNVPILGIVENMSYYEQEGRKHYLFGQGGGERLAHEKGLAYLGQVPVDPVLCLCGDTGSSIFERGDASKVLSTGAFLELASQVFNGISHLKQDRDGVVKISQKDPFTLKVEWSDGKISEMLLKELQKQCPCANCRENKPVESGENVSAKSINKVGRYALRIEFTSGCSSGIYSHAMLRSLAGL